MRGFFIIFSSILIVGEGYHLKNCKPKIAIVGGGIGGASASYFSSELFENNADIDLYEAKTIGGRLATVQVNENEYDSGGAIIHPRNKYMQEFVKLLGLERRPTSEELSGIWNGDEFVFTSSKYEAITLMKLLYNYGIDPLTLNSHVSSFIDYFENIYQLQDARKSFANVTALLAAMSPNLTKLLGVSIKDYLLNLGYKEKLIDELVRTTLVVNYGQDTNVHTMVGCVSLAGMEPGLWSVKGGNKKVPEHLIYRNGNVSVIPSYVKKIVNIPLEDGGNLYEIHYSNKDSTMIMKSVYDIVILATPLTRDQEFPIIFEGFPEDGFHSPGEYHTTIATFVTADLNAHYFGLEEDLDNILSCNPNKSIISSLGKLDSVEGPIKHGGAWKIFTNAPLKPAVLNEMFSNVKEMKEIIWKAYPEYSTNIRHDKFKLHNALYHVNAIEWLASAMEMSAIGGRNVAILAYEDFIKKCTLMDDTTHTTTSANTPSTEL